MVCFVENYLHEIPNDIQFKIMDIFTEQKKIELKKVEILQNKIDNEEFDDIIFMLRCLKDDYDMEDDEDLLYDYKHQIIDGCCSEEHERDEYENLKKEVNKYGIFKALKLGIEEFGDDLYDIANETEIMLYRKCYYNILNNHFDYTYEDLKLIKDYDINLW